MQIERENLKSRLYRFAFNIWPCFFGTGATVTYIAHDFSFIRVRLRLNWRTRNRVGTIFGGSMYASTDPFFMIQLMAILGKDYVVWDKAAAIRFRRPGEGELFVEFHVGPDLIAEVKEKVEQNAEHDFTWRAELKDAAGRVYAEIDKTLYVAKREVYERKKAARAARQQ